MESHSIRVTVLMSVYNGQQYLEQSIESILNQIFSDFEFLIIDDGSTDQSASIIERFAMRDSRIRVVQHTTNIGLTKSLNEGLSVAAGEYIARQDCDDISYPDRLQKAVEALDADQHLAFVTSSLHLIDGAGTRTGMLTHDRDGNLNRWNMLFGNTISGHSAITFRKKLVLTYGGYDETLRYAQDYDLWLRMMEHHAIYSYPEPLIGLRNHASNLSNQKKLEQSQDAMRARQRALHRIGVERQPDDEILEKLSEFWFNRLSSAADGSRVHEWIMLLFRLFVTRYRPGKNAIKKIRRRCSNRFLDAIAGAPDRITRLRLLKYAMIWSPYATLRHVIQLIR